MFDWLWHGRADAQMYCDQVAFQNWMADQARLAALKAKARAEAETYRAMAAAAERDTGAIIEGTFTVVEEPKLLEAK